MPKIYIFFYVYGVIRNPAENHCVPPIPSAATTCHRIYSQFKEFGCCDDCCEHVCGALRDDYEEEGCFTSTQPS